MCSHARSLARLNSGSWDDAAESRCGAIRLRVGHPSRRQIEATPYSIFLTDPASSRSPAYSPAGRGIWRAAAPAAMVINHRQTILPCANVIPARSLARLNTGSARDDAAGWVHKRRRSRRRQSRGNSMRKLKRFYVYIMTNRSRSHVLYTGITGNLPKRVFQHENKLVPGFTSRYNLTRLVYYEQFVYPPRRLRERRKSRDGGEARRFGLSSR